MLEKNQVHRHINIKQGETMVELKQNTYTQSQSTAIDAGLREYMMKVYNYMTSGLAISGLVAWGFSQSPALMGAIYGTGQYHK